MYVTGIHTFLAREKVVKTIGLYVIVADLQSIFNIKV